MSHYFIIMLGVNMLNVVRLSVAASRVLLAMTGFFVAALASSENGGKKNKLK